MINLTPYTRLALLAMIATATLAPRDASAQPTTFPAALAARLDSVLAAVRVATNTTGVAAAIISPRHGTWLGASGVADIGTGELVTSDMLFGIGSVTKTFTSALALRLVEEGRISLEDTVGRWIAGVRNVNGAVTVRQLLAHTSGLYNYTNSQEFWAAVNADMDHFMTPEEILTFVGPRSFSPGFGWEYSNTNYVLLGMIIERVTGMSFEDAIADRLLEPLALRTIAMGTLDTLPGPVSGNHIDTDGDGDLDNLGALPRRAIYSGAWAAGGLYSSVGDVARWGHELYRGRVLSPEMMTELTTFRAVSGLGPNGGYGLGIIRVRIDGRNAVGHTGGIPGFSTALWHYPADSVTIAVVINEDSQVTTSTAAWLIRALAQGAAAPLDRDDAQRVQAWPNPFTDHVTIGFAATALGTATVRVFDAMGRRVRTLLEGTVDMGEQRIVWDGADDAGVRVAVGAYVVRVEQDASSASEIVVVR